ncbi:hypothetical protein GCM10009738_22320 [Kitasatospora viridis]
MTLPNSPNFPNGPLPSFQAVPFSDRCRRLWGDGDHLLIGVSPGNSYFSAGRIAELVRWARESFDRVDVVHADLHVAAQFEAAGYTAEHAERRAAKEVKATARRIRSGVEQAGRSGVHCHPLSAFTGDPAYRRLRATVDLALEGDAELAAAAEGMARSFLAARLTPDHRPTPTQLAAGLDYIAAELPFFLDTPALLGVRSSISCYHLELPLTPVLFGRAHGLRAQPRQGYAVVRPAPVLAAV